MREEEEAVEMLDYYLNKSMSKSYSALKWETKHSSYYTPKFD